MSWSRRHLCDADGFGHVCEGVCKTGTDRADHEVDGRALLAELYLGIELLGDSYRGGDSGISQAGGFNAGEEVLCELRFRLWESHAANLLS